MNAPGAATGGQPDGAVVPTLAEALTSAVAALDGPREASHVDAELLLSAAIGRPRHHLRTWPQARPSAAEYARFLHLVTRRGEGEPVAYLLGERGFWTFDLEVTAETLIPRPETELLVELVLGLDLPGTGVRALDLGTGTGAIGIALALERPGWTVVASDISRHCLEVAARNAQRLGVENLTLRRGDWLDAAGAERFDLIVSNPPYVADQDPHLMQGDLRFEPSLALRGGGDGLDAIRTIVAGAPVHLEHGGWLAIEHGFDQGERVRALLSARGFDDPRTHADLGARERVSLASHRPAPGAGAPGT